MTLLLEYKQLVAEVPPKVIHTDEENRSYVAKIEELNNRWSELSRAERDLYETLAVLVEDFEKKTYNLRAATPIEAIKELMLANNLRQKDLIGVFETASVVSEVLKGRRALTTDHIRRLSKRFNVSPALFL
jgi:HTH-type transcriptional regulator/antitoxin HigA